ncbi:MAG: hypothetical protein J6X79_05235 [Bacteroidales bacterium]|nr:hypothetical protein [Bacteroidales bacterium]
MAKQTGGHLGGFSGKLGTVVGYMWRGRWCVRAHNPYPANPRTPRQVEHREMFRQEVQLAATMRAAVNKGFKEVSYELGMTPYNLFVHLNQHAFSLNEGIFTVDYSALRLSTGPLQEAVYGAPEWTADNVLTVRFEGGSGRWNDYVRLYVYCPEWSTGILTAPVYRKDKKVSVMLSDMFVGREVHVYGLVSNDEGLWAETTYVGSLVCDETAEDNEPQTEESAQPPVRPSAESRPTAINDKAIPASASTGPPAT